MHESVATSRPVSVWRPDAMEPLSLLIGSLALVTFLSMRMHPFSKALQLSLEAGLAIALTLYLIRSLSLIVRRAGNPEATRELGSGIALCGGAVMVALLAVLTVVPPELDRQAFLTDVDTQQTVALLGGNLPDLAINERHYREALPVVALVRAQAERTRLASADFQRTAEFMRNPLSASGLTDPDRRKETALRLESLETSGATMDQEARRLVGPEFREALMALPVPEGLKQDVAKATAQNEQFSACLEWIAVNRKMVDRLKAAFALTRTHLVARPGQNPLFDSPAPAAAYNRIIDELRDLATRADRLRVQTMVRIVDVKR